MLWAGEMHDVAVAEPDEVLGGDPGPVELVDRDTVEARPRAAVDRDQRNPNSKPCMASSAVRCAAMSTIASMFCESSVSTAPRIDSGSASSMLEMLTL